MFDPGRTGKRALMAGSDERALPRGRHTLPRSEVEGSQRARLQEAVVGHIAEHGYAGTTVADVVRRAAVSRETFYGFYQGKAECYATALEAFRARVTDAAPAPADGAEVTAADVEAWLGQQLEALATEPDHTQCLLFEGEQSERPTMLRGPYADLLQRYLRPRDDFTAPAFAAMTRELVADAVAEGRCTELPALVAPVMALLRTHRMALGATA